MNPYGDGSDGALNVTSGSYSLALNTKHQFTTVNIASGATLTSGSTTGSVLYVVATDSITVDGSIDVSNIVNRGNNAWSVIIDGVSYDTPGVASGGAGGATNGQSASAQGSGFGGGGGGGNATSPSEPGGGGGAGGQSPSGGVGNVVSSGGGPVSSAGGSGSQSGGGGGGAYAEWISGSGSAVADGGDGAGAHGGTGGNANSYITGSGQRTIWAGGGGGAGGNAGRSGAHVVLKAPTVVINGTLVASGTSGGAGGNGGLGRANTTTFPSLSGMAGGGGGGGNAGNIYITHANNFVDAGTYSMAGGGGGAAGSTSSGSVTVAALSGTSGSAGVMSDDVFYAPRSELSGGGSVEFVSEDIGHIDIVSGGPAVGRATYITKYQALPQKEYEYRVFDSAGNYLATWPDVTSEFHYGQRINEAPSELNVKLSRSPDNRVVSLDILRDEDNDPVLDDNSDQILVQAETPNSVGDGTDVDINYNVDVYAFYGGYDALLDENGDAILDENNDPILASFGRPNGERVYSGYIADYELIFGEETGVSVVVVPHATEMSHVVFKDGSNTTVEYSGTDPVLMARDAMDDYIAQGGVITYSAVSMPLSGESSSYNFNLQTTRESVDKSVDLLPSGYYHFVHPGENRQYLLPKGTSADHVFYYEKHFTELKLRKSITQLVNKVYFVGGDDGSGKLFKYYEDAASISSLRPGLERLSDSRVTLDASAETLSERQIELYKPPRYRTSITISDAVYDIESIRLGQMSGIKNTGTFVDSLLLQIVGASRHPHVIVLDLDMIVPNETRRLIELKKSLMNQEVEGIPVIPS